MEFIDKERCRFYLRFNEHRWITTFFSFSEGVYAYRTGGCHPFSLHIHFVASCHRHTYVQLRIIIWTIVTFDILDETSSKLLTY